MRKIVPFLILACSAAGLCAQANGAAPSRQVFNIALVESGQSAEALDQMKALRHGLAYLELLEKPRDDDSQVTNMSDLWQRMVLQSRSGNLRFLDDGQYSFDWDAGTGNDPLQPLLKRIREKNDVDLVIVLGTLASLRVKEAIRDIPLLSLTATNPLTSGLSASLRDSGQSNFVAHIDLNRTWRQLNFFHRLFRIKRLGIVYSNQHPEEMQGIDLPEIERAAKEFGFELVPCHITDEKRRAEQYLKCTDKLSKSRIQGFFIPYLYNLSINDLPRILEPLIDADIPTFAQSGPEIVRQGALLSLYPHDVEDLGIFTAQMLERIIQGHPVSSINGAYKANLGLSINLKTASKVNWSPPVTLMGVVDQVFH